MLVKTFNVHSSPYNSTGGGFPLAGIMRKSSLCSVDSLPKKSTISDTTATRTTPHGAQCTHCTTCQCGQDVVNMTTHSESPLVASPPTQSMRKTSLPKMDVYSNVNHSTTLPGQQEEN